MINYQGIEYFVLPQLPEYAISRCGQTISLKYGKIKVWKQHKKDSGHHYVIGYLNRVQISYFVHRLVLEMFIGPCPYGLECRHLDGNPSNNRVENLMWSTRIANQRDRDKHGTSNLGRKHPPRSVESRLKYSLAKLGIPKSEEHKRKISETLTGRTTHPPSEETRIKISAALIAYHRKV